MSLDSYPGNGLYRSTDGGASWTRLMTRFPHGVPTRISSIAVDPFDSDLVCIGSVAHSDEEPVSLRFCRVDQDRLVFARDMVAVPNYNVHSVVFHPGRKGMLFAAVDARGAANGIWRSTNRGQGNWEHLTSGLPSSEMFGRTSLAISPSDPDVIWAYAADRRDRVLGVFVSRNAGKDWMSAGGRHFGHEKNGSYNNCIVVHPDIPGFVVCGGVNLHLTDNWGSDWQQITEWDRQRGNARYAHADHHALAMPKGNCIYDCNDGGLDYCDDVRPHTEARWENRSSGLVTTMFYDVDVAPSEGRVFGGGAQDNGTLVHNFDAPVGEFVQGIGGDGGWILFDPFDPNHIFGSFQHMNIRRHTADGGWSTVTPSDATDDERHAVWLSVMAMDCHEDSEDPRMVFAGSTRVWKTVDDGESWSAVSDHLDGSAITALDVASKNPLMVYAATEEGGVFRSTDAGNSWSENLAGPELPRRVITGIQAHPDDESHVLLTFAAVPDHAPWGAPDAKDEFVFEKYAHVYASLDGGLTWTSADPKQQCPDVPHHGLAFETRPPYRVFVANDAGVWAGSWDETLKNYHWENFTGNLPRQMVTDVVYHAGTHSLTASTYGRGIWRLQLPKLPRARKTKSKKPR
ncbi:MAG: hypothetical protein U0Q16_33925 [Bryobacteraceae bacterium]